MGHGGLGAPLTGGLARRVPQDVHGPGAARRAGPQQLPCDGGGAVAALPHGVGGREVRGPAPVLGPALEHRVPQQPVGPAGAAPRVGAEQAESGRGGEPAGDPGGVGTGHPGEDLGQMPDGGGVGGRAGADRAVRGGGCGRAAGDVRPGVLQDGQRPGDRGGARSGGLQPPGHGGLVGPRVQHRGGLRHGLGPAAAEVLQQGVQQQRMAGRGADAALHPGPGRVPDAATRQERGGPAGQRGEGVGADQVGREGVGQPGGGRGDVVLAALGHQQQDGHPVDVPGGLHEPAPGGGIGQVRVVHGDEEGTVLGQLGHA